jgi:capsular polysaccharide transport system ATP-binding protein
MIRFENVTKSYRVGNARKVVMRGVSITFPRGRSVGLIGRNGCGKSTMLRMIAGASEPDKGRIVKTVNVSWPLGFSGGFHPALTGAQNARFVARIYGVDTDDMIARVEEFAELGPFMRMRLSSYSSGMRARLAFGVSMAIDFDVYLVDEITAVGDAAFKKKCADAFAAKSQKADIIMVSHAQATIRDYCDCGVVLEDGVLTYYDNVEDALAAHAANMHRPVPTLA